MILDVSLISISQTSVTKKFMRHLIQVSEIPYIILVKFNIFHGHLKNTQKSAICNYQ